MIQARSNEKSTVETKINPYFLASHILSLQYATSIIITALFSALLFHFSIITALLQDCFH